MGQEPESYNNGNRPTVSLLSSRPTPLSSAKHKPKLGYLKFSGLNQNFVYISYVLWSTIIDSVIHITHMHFVDDIFRVDVVAIHGLSDNERRSHKSRRQDNAGENSFYGPWSSNHGSRCEDGESSTDEDSYAIRMLTCSYWSWTRKGKLRLV